jgi:glycosyltransferase involved in cell wall biosynthesis
MALTQRFASSLARSGRPTVLHVTEAMGGGLEAAVVDFVRSAPQLDHALLYTRRGDFRTKDELEAHFVSVVDAGRGVRALAGRYSAVLSAVHPDIVHLHSAWAGIIGRTRLDASHVPIVYSPHSFYFERVDVDGLRRASARFVERMLATRTATIAALTPYEVALAHRIGATADYVPNVVRLPADLVRGADYEPGRIVAIGRVTGQKDPAFFLQVKAAADASLPGLAWIWVGGGDPRIAIRLRAAGVQVTGWLPRSEALSLLVTAHVYLHTAAWEGSPITLLEAADLGVPVVARSIPALDSLGYDPSLRDPASVARRIIDVVDGRRSGRSPLPTGPSQEEALALIYGRLLAARLGVTEGARPAEGSGHESSSGLAA